MVKVSNYRTCIIAAVIYLPIVILVAIKPPFNYRTLFVLIFAPLNCIVSAHRFVADETGVRNEYALNVFHEAPKLLYADMIDVSAYFSRFKLFNFKGPRAYNVLIVTLKNAETIEIKHWFRKSKMVPLLAKLAERGIPIIIHDVKNDDLLK